MATKPRKKSAPPAYDRDMIFAQACEWVAQGKPLLEFCRQEGMPHPSRIYGWILDSEDYALRFARARDSGSDVIAEEALAIIDATPAELLTESGSRIDPAHVAWLKNRAEFRLKLLAKWNPKKYGEQSKVNLEHSGTVGLSINIDLT